MKALRFVITAVFIGLALVFFLVHPGFEPAAETEAEHPQIAVNLDEIPLAIPEPIGAAATPAPAPLARNLVATAAGQVRVPHGFIRVAPGVPLTLVEDRGQSVRVQLGGSTIEVPREVVANSDRPSAEPEPVTAPRWVQRALSTATTAPPRSLGIEAHEIGTGKGIERNWQADWGSFDRDYYRTKGLEVNVSNVSRRDSGDCEATVLWLKRSLVNGELAVHHSEKIPLRVGAVSSERRRFWCPLLASNEANYKALGERDLRGAKLDGWLVLVTRDDLTLAGLGSTQPARDLLRAPDRLTALIASYSPSGRVATTEPPRWRNSAERAEWRANRGPAQTVGAR